MALTDDERNALVAYRLEKARETMLQVRGVLPLRYWEIIANGGLIIPISSFFSHMRNSLIILESNPLPCCQNEDSSVPGCHFIRKLKNSLLKTDYYAPSAQDTSRGSAPP